MMSESAMRHASQPIKDAVKVFAKPRFGVFLEDGRFEEISPVSKRAQEFPPPSWVGGPRDLQLIHAVFAQASTQSSVAKGTIEGTIRFMRSAPAEQKCVCCPSGGGHIFGRSVDWDRWETNYPEHFGNGPNVLLMSTALDANSHEGKRVRVTIEVLDGALATDEQKGGAA